MSATAYSLDSLREKITALVEKAREEVIENHERAGQVASGRTKASLRVESKTSSAGMSVVLWGRKFFQGLETGRAGGRVPRGFYYMIREWAIDKGLHFATNSELSTFAYFVSRKIAREGTALYREGGRSDIYSPVFKELIGEIERELDIFFDGYSDTMFTEAMNTIKIN